MDALPPVLSNFLPLYRSNGVDAVGLNPLALGQFEKQHQEIDALLLAMDAGQRLKELVKDGRPLEKYPAASPILALQTIVDNIQERAQFKGHQGRLYIATFSHDGQRIVTASSDKTAKVWDAKGNLLADLKGHKHEVTSAIFSPDGQRIVTASSDKTAKVWDTKGNLLADLKENYAYVGSAISPDGELIVTTSWNLDSSYSRTLAGNPKLWDMKGNLVAELKGHQGKVNSTVFSPDGQRIVTASDDNTAKVWDLKGNLLADLKGHQGIVYSAVFSPDGKRILTESSDGTAKVWDTKGNLLADLKEYKKEVSRAAFSSDGKRVFTVFSDGSINTWQVGELDDLLARGCNWLQDYFISHPETRESLKVCQVKS
ncbi:WD40 repeat domain-containing protein [Nostoc sp.]|uniref:WD40 repeat domain-containing protein n=1 Tax=Nostoc sp. TaxID=1180 RepID=UPI002FFC0AC9